MIRFLCAVVLTVCIEACIGSASWCERVANKARNARDINAHELNRWKYQAYCSGR